MENNKDKKKPNINPKDLTRTFSIIWFILVFIFSFCFMVPEIKNNQTNIAICAGVIFGALGVSIIVWLVWFLILRKKNQTENDKNIKKAIKLEEEKELKEKGKKK